jgi:ubiquinone/menaquinone biosynthesis C-methylase UbiE
VDKRKNFFDDHAASWDERHHGGNESELDHLVRSFELSEGDSVLDVGTGTGVLLPFIRKAVGPRGKVAAMDFAFRMLEEAKRRPGPSFGNLVNASVDAIPCRGGVFDKVTCFSSFPHFPNKERALSEMVRVLKPGGSVSIAHLKSIEEIRELHRQVGGAVAQDHLPAPGMLRELMGRTGLQGVDVINQPGTFLARGWKR